MNNSTLKSTLVAAALSLSLSLLAPVAQAQSAKPSRDTGAGHSIATQGNAALRAIREEMKSAVRFVKPVLPARPRKVSAPSAAAPSAGPGASLAANAACAK